MDSFLLTFIQRKQKEINLNGVGSHGHFEFGAVHSWDFFVIVVVSGAGRAGRPVAPADPPGRPNSPSARKEGKNDGGRTGGERRPQNAKKSVVFDTAILIMQG